MSYLVNETKRYRFFHLPDMKERQVMFKDNLLERGEPALQEVESPHFVPDSPHRPSKQEIEARAPLPPDSPAAERPELPAQAEERQPEASGKIGRASCRERV